MTEHESPPTTATAEDQTDPLLGMTVDGKYRIERVLGVGGMATVYAATRLQIGDTAAIKVLTPESRAIPLAVARFQREVRAAARIKHPNVVTIYDFGTLPDGRAYMVMEYITGESLRDELKRVGRLSPERAVAIMTSVCAAIHAAHQEGILHRDLKPENIMLARMRDGSEVVKVVDFGVAELHEQAAASAMTKLTEHGLMVGTPHYMSPEQCRSEPLDPRSDVYSLGIILYELLTGTVPFNARTVSAVIIQQATETPRRPRDLNPDLSWALEHVVMRALEKDPARRPQTAAELAQDLSLSLTNTRPLASGARPSGALRLTSSPGGFVPPPTHEMSGFAAPPTREMTGPLTPPTSGGAADHPSLRNVVVRRSGTLRYDSLTGIRNLTFLKQEVESLVAARRTASLLLVGVDGMKAYNERFGYAVGDNLLRELAHWLREHVGELGVVARLGGDEFAILLPGSTAPDAIVFADRMIQQLATQRFLRAEVPGGVTVQVTIAVVVSPDDATTGVGLLDAGGQALAVAKQRAPGRVYRQGVDEAALQTHPNFNAFVGRTAELHKLHEMYDRTVAGRGQPVLVLGPTGIGKTRLLHEFRRRLAGFEVTFLSMPFYEAGQGTPYKSFYDSLRGTLQLLLEAHEPAELQQMFGPLAERVALEFATEDGFLHFCDAVQSENQHERFLAFDYLVALYTALAHRQVTILCVDDAHFADELSLDMLAYLARSMSGLRLMLVLTARTESLTEQHPLRHWMRAVNQSVGFESLTLEPLSLEDATALVYATFPKVKVAPATVARLHAETRGNPFFLAEILRHLAQCQHVRWQDDGWVFPPLTDVSLPPSVIEVVEATFSRLSPAALELLSQAAVIGMDFTFDLLLAVTERPEREVLAAVEEGLAQGIITELTDAEEDSYRFRHGTVQKVLYNRLNRRRRRTTHAAVGHALERAATATGRGGRLAGELAYHFHQAAEHLPTLRYAAAAGAQAWRSWAIDEALKYFGWAEEAERRLNILVDVIFDEKEASFDNVPVEQLRLLTDFNLNYGQLLVHIGRLDEAEKKLQLAQTLARPSQDEHLRGRTLAALGELCEARSEYSSALLYCHQALEVLRRTGDKRAEARTMAVIGTLYGRLGQFTRAADSLDKALTLGRAIRDRQVEALALREGAFVRARQGEFAKAMALAQEGIAAAERLADPLGASIATSIMGVVLRLQGEYEAAIERFQRARQLTQDLNRPRSECIERINIAECLVRLGDLSQALEQGQAALDIALRIGNRQLEGLATLCIGYAYRQREELGAAVVCFQSAHKLLSAISDRAAECDALLALADWHCLDRHPVEALELVQQAATVLPDATARPWQWRIAVMSARCHRLLRQMDVARADLAKARAVIEDLQANLSPTVNPRHFARVIEPFHAEWRETYGE
ncbi:MAG: protein kinase [Chloracidobacterium sp.]|nr:protein kinase [Chloracidobacterium sp.]MDW8218144.1 protein kinase [Acidobacteriota bacterium]